MKVPATFVRLLLETAFLIVVAVAVAVADLRPLAIVLVMAAAWVLVSVLERTASRRPRSGRLGFLFGGRGERPAAEPEEPAPVQEVSAEHPPEPAPGPGPDPQPEPPPEPVPEPAPEPPPVPGPQPSVREAAPAPELRAVPEPPEPPEPAEAPPEEPEPDDRVVAFIPGSNGPRRWNLWDLERLARAGEGADSARDEERTVLLMQLRQFAGADGMLPESFDPLVRESFGELIGTGRP
jgi:outer membrane biosynthesis protein TonB